MFIKIYINLSLLNKIFLINIFILTSILLNFIKTASANGDLELQLLMSREYGNLPVYCQYKLTSIKYDDNYIDKNGVINFPPNFSKNVNKWKNAIGPQNWTYFHHYCTGIADYKEYIVMNLEEKKRFKSYQLNKALSQFEFMRRANTLNFPLWYDLYRYEYIIYSELGDPQKATWAIKQAQKYKK